MTRSPSPSGRRATTAPRCVRRTTNTPTTTKAMTMTANSATDIDGSYDAARGFERLHRGATAVGACLYEWARGYRADWWVIRPVACDSADFSVVSIRSPVAAHTTANWLRANRSAI